MTIRLLAFALALTASVPATAQTLDIYVIDVEGGNATLFVSPSGESMLIEVMRSGRRVAPAESISVLRGRCINSLARLPQSFLQINRSAAYPVRYSQRLKTMLERVRRRVRRSTLK